MQEQSDLQGERDRLAEQLMSDERILGAAPEEATRLLLDRALAALNAAAATAPDADSFARIGEAIRQQARALADAAAEAADPLAVVAGGALAETATETAETPPPAATEAPELESPLSDGDGETPPPAAVETWGPEPEPEPEPDSTVSDSNGEPPPLPAVEALEPPPEPEPDGVVEPDAAPEGDDAAQEQPGGLWRRIRHWWG